VLVTKGLSNKGVLVHRLVCLTKVTPIFFHKATVKFISGLAKFYVDSKDYEVQIYYTFDMLITCHKEIGVFSLRKQGCFFLTYRSKMYNGNCNYNLRIQTQTYWIWQYFCTIRAVQILSHLTNTGKLKYSVFEYVTTFSIPLGNHNRP
jgi:hypothetical protein